VGSYPSCIVPLAEAALAGDGLVGGKAASLGSLIQAGFRVPRGFCITTRAYEQFIAEAGLSRHVAMELGRKPLDAMRWEELWDAALRIRSTFLQTGIPETIAVQIRQALADHVGDSAVAVRSSAPGEDSQQRSFAGLHESIVGVHGDSAVLDAVRTVWASLWSDAALLYRRELSLDPNQSRMAVLVQAVELADCSGVAFNRDPRSPDADCAVIEAVPGACALLVDGSVDPDRWTLTRSSGELIEWRPGRRGSDDDTPLLDSRDLAHLLGVLSRIETLFAWPPDVEWTGRAPDTVVLQARPITSTPPDAEDERGWYLTLRPTLRRLSALAARVTDELIPALESEGVRFAAQDLALCTDAELAAALLERSDSLRRWKNTYWDEFIPLAHGVRQLARYYTDTVRPDDPYEFIGLLKSEDMLATRRNQAMADLAATLRGNAQLRLAVSDARAAMARADARTWRRWLEPVRELRGGPGFLDAFDSLAARFMDVMYGAERLLDRPDLLLHTLLELADAAPRHARPVEPPRGSGRAELEERLFNAVGPARRDEAVEVLRIGRVSWRLRDDDNLLLSRVESQLNRAIAMALDRLRVQGRLSREPRRSDDLVRAIATALSEPGAVLDLPAATPEDTKVEILSQETPRQLIGQPASPGLASGRVCRITEGADIGRFHAGNVLVCDAIQPMMTHLVPLAAAVVERRGGMLIHGAIIAREMGIPCVNGVARAVEQLRDGDLVTVDGHLGIVTVGPPEFDLEFRQ
jgi:phosphohistidine swiveling domain-containing protein